MSSNSGMTQYSSATARVGRRPLHRSLMAMGTISVTLTAGFYMACLPLLGPDAILALGRASIASAVMIAHCDRQHAGPIRRGELLAVLAVFALTFVAQYLSSLYLYGEWRGPGDVL